MTRDERGVGLLEMTIAMALLGMLMGGALSMLFRTQVTYELQQVQANVRQQARIAFDTISTELRLAGYRIDNLTEALEDARPNRLQFVGDIDNSAAGPPCDAGFENAANGGAERVTYELTSGELRRSVECWNGSSWTAEVDAQVLADNLNGDQSLFSFFDASGNAIAVSGGALTAAQRATVRVVAMNFDLLDPDDPIEIGADHARFAITGRVLLPNVN